MIEKTINTLKSAKFWVAAFVLAFIAFILSLIIAGQLKILNPQDPTSPTSNVGAQITPGAGDFMAIEECLSLPWDQQNGCYDEFILNYGEDKEIVEILSGLEQARAVSDVFENSCHPMAHAIGRLSLTRYGNVGDAFQACDFTCHSGCYHGVMERMFYDDNEILDGTQHLSLDQMRDKVPGICDESNFDDPTQSIIFQCLHGVGHAILYTMDYNLPEALKACDLLENDYERSSCYGGVVMENVTAFDKSKRYILDNDPHYPCNILDTKYKYDCYQMQTSIMTEVGVGVEEQGAECLNAGSDYLIRACHISVGRDLSNTVRAGRPEYVASVCQKDVSTGYTNDCVAGAVYALIDNTWDAQYAYQLCNSLLSENQEYCYQISNRYLPIYENNFESIESQCNEFADQNLELCLSNLT